MVQATKWAASSIDSPTFSGENGQSVSRWLRIVGQKILVTMTPHQWLDIVDARLEGEGSKMGGQHTYDSQNVSIRCD